MTNDFDGIKVFNCDLCLAVCYLKTVKLFKGDFILMTEKWLFFFFPPLAAASNQSRQRPKLIACISRAGNRVHSQF